MYDMHFVGKRSFCYVGQVMWLRLGRWHDPAGAPRDWLLWNGRELVSAALAGAR